MKKYEKIIQALYQIDKTSYEVFEKKLTFEPRSKEWNELEIREDILDGIAKNHLLALKKCTLWYRQRAKTIEDLELVAELENEYDVFYEQFVCELTEEELTKQAMDILAVVFENEGLNTNILNIKEATPSSMQNFQLENLGQGVARPLPYSKYRYKITRGHLNDRSYEH